MVDELPVDGNVRSVETEEETRVARLKWRKTQENQRNHARAREKKKLATSGASETCDDSGEDATDSDATISDVIIQFEALVHMAKAAKIAGKDSRVKTLQLRLLVDVAGKTYQQTKQALETSEAREHLAAGRTSRKDRALE